MDCLSVLQPWTACSSHWWMDGCLEPNPCMQKVTDTVQHGQATRLTQQQVDHQQSNCTWSIVLFTDMKTETGHCKWMHYLHHDIQNIYVNILLLTIHWCFIQMKQKYHFWGFFWDISALKLHIHLNWFILKYNLFNKDYIVILTPDVYVWNNDLLSLE